MAWINPVNVSPQSLTAAQQALAMPQAPLQPYKGPRSAQYDPIIEALTAQASNTGPVQSPWEALARVGSGALGGYTAGLREKAKTGESKAYNESIIRALTGGDVESLGTMGDRIDPALAALVGDRAKSRDVLKEKNATLDQLANYGSVGTEQMNPQERARAFKSGVMSPSAKADTTVLPQNSRLVGGQGQTLASNPAPAGGPFAGNDLDAQSLNIVAAYEKARAEGQPTSPQDDYLYALAQRQLTAAKTVGTPETGFTQVTQPPLPQYGGAQQPGGPAAAGPTLTPLTPPQPRQDQANAGTFATRMQAADQLLATLDTQGADGWAQFLAAVPGGNYAQSADFQRYDRARRDFVNAQLRRESLSTIRDDEFKSADKQYFPQPGDRPEVIADKRKARADAVTNMAGLAGPGYRQPAAQQQTTPPPAPQTYTEIPAGAVPVPELTVPGRREVYRVPDPTSPTGFKLISREP